jgi:hypothetical protein
MDTLHFEVVGRLWSGARSAYQYSTPDTPKWTRKVARSVAEQIRNPAASLTPPPPSVPKMGDFAAIEDVRIVRESNVYEHAGFGISRRTDTFTTLAGWKRSGSARRYARCVNGR